jgi:hypothetical protein
VQNPVIENLKAATKKELATKTQENDKYDQNESAEEEKAISMPLICNPLSKLMTPVLMSLQ